MRNDQNSYSKVTKFRIREIRFTMQIKFKILTTVVDTTLHMIGTMDQPMTDARALIMVAIGILNMVDIAGILFICHYYFFFIKNVNFIKIISWKIGIRDFSLHSPFFNHWPTIKFFFFVLDLSFSIGHRPLLFNEKLDKILASFRYVQPLKWSIWLWHLELIVTQLLARGTTIITRVNLNLIF